MSQKLFCPHCGRCLGECSCTDETGVCKVLTEKPKNSKKKQMIHNMKCNKCKNHIFVLMEFSK